MIDAVIASSYKNNMLKEYLALTKPSVMSLVLFTGLVALLVEGSLLKQPVYIILFLIALFMTGGSANGLNQYFERDIDAKMKRTASRRPIPLGTITKGQALIFSITIGLAGVLLLGFVFNWYAAALSLGTIFFYALFYTLYLKPRTTLNIVIGGAAGAMAPVGAWVAATGSFATEAWLMFLLVFIWTPPHFWALSLFCREDYVKAKLPMLPVVRGVSHTLNQITVYSLLMVAVSVLPFWFGSGWIYLIVAVALGARFLFLVLKARSARDDASYRRLFLFSIVYLFVLFSAMVVDALPSGV